MDILNTKIKNILTEKNTKIRPENIKKDVNILGITGTYEGQKPSGTINITQNGTVDVSNYASANVNVPTPAPTLQNKSITITENGTQTITADSGYDGINEVEITTNVQATSEYNAKMKTVIENYFDFKLLIEEPPMLDFSQITTLSGAFSSCTNLKKVNLTNTNRITNCYNAFYFCSSLEDINIFDTSKVTNFNRMFTGCTSLSNESLNNILAMCIGATSFTGTKALSTLGLTSQQATTCQGLSNWNDFVAAGWTTGY